MKGLILKTFKNIDLLFSKVYCNFFEPDTYLIILLFHGLFKDQSEIDQNLIDPQQRITLNDFERVILHFKKQGFNFTNPNEMSKGLDKHKKHVLFTFDDGYYNNKECLSLLSKHNVDCTFYISTNHIKEQRLFWWDVIYREEKLKGTPENKIFASYKELKHLTHDKIEAEVKKLYGEDCFKPKGDLDRPFTPQELAEFSKNKHVFIGNHTTDHAILDNYDYKSAKEQIQNCQIDLKNIIGYEPNSISYPNGNFNSETIDICKSLGIEFGITGITRQNLSLSDSNNYKLGRFVPYAGRNLERQCQLFQSSFSSYALVKDLNKKNK